MLQAKFQRKLRAKRTPAEPRMREGPSLDESHRGRDIRTLGDTVPKPALARAALRSRTPRVEAQHGDIRERGQSSSRLPNEVRIHVPSGRRQRVERNERGIRVAILRQRKF